MSNDTIGPLESGMEEGHSFLLIPKADLSSHPDFPILYDKSVKFTMEIFSFGCNNSIFDKVSVYSWFKVCMVHGALIPAFIKSNILLSVFAVAICFNLDVSGY